MQFLKKNICSILCLTLLVFLATSGDAYAVGVTANDLMSKATKKASTVFTSVKTIVFVLGGFGLIALAFMAIFGKLDWKKFAALATGLAILAAAGAIVEYATGASMQGSDTNLKDTFGTDM